MKIHEYQAKEVLRKHKVNVPYGVVIDKKEDSEDSEEDDEIFPEINYKSKLIELMDLNGLKT